MDNRPIGIMDSGIGGLTVAKVLHEQYPLEGICFLGDSLRNPYGEKTQEDIVRYSFAIRDFLLRQNVKMILIACNTISFNVPPSFFAGDIPVVKMSMDVPAENAGKIGIFATPATIGTHVHKEYFRKKYPDKAVAEIPCEGLAAAIERNEGENVISALVEKALKEYHAFDIDTGVWACTHYSLIGDIFRRLLPKVSFLNPALPTVEQGMEILRAQDRLADRAQEKRFYFTADPEHAEPIVEKIFGRVKTEKAELTGV